MTSSAIRRCAPIVLSVLIAAGLRAAPQNAPKPPVFEVVSIKPVRDCSSGSGRPIVTPGRAEISCVTARTLIRLAYGTFTGGQMNARQLNVVEGPAWIDTEYYNLAAKTSAPATVEQIVEPMFRAVLHDRFKLKVHIEPRETAVYLLTAGDKPNLRPTKDGECVPVDLFAQTQNPNPAGGGPPTCGSSRGVTKNGLLAFDWTGVTMEQFVCRLPSLDRPAVDRTGLTGQFTIHLDFVPQRPEGAVMLNGQMVTLPPAADDGGPTIFTALQKQLGLKLAPGKAPIPVIVVDSIERPSEN